MRPKWKLDDDVIRIDEYNMKDNHAAQNTICNIIRCRELSEGKKLFAERCAAKAKD